MWKKSDLTRREFARRSAGALTAAAAPAFLFPARAEAQQKTLRIMQWSHFVPGYDKWFDGVFCKEWGAKHGTKVVVDHIGVNDINTRAAAEAAAKKGHDLFLFMSPPAAYEKVLIDHTDVVQAAEKKYGKAIGLAERSTYNPKTKRYFAFSDSFVPDPGNYRKDLWEKVGYPNGPDTWDDLRVGGAKIKSSKEMGNPVGVGLSQELDSNMAMRACLWSFGGAEQDSEGRVTINSKETIEALKFVRALYKETMTPEVFTWDPASNNRGILAGKLSFVCNAISVTRTAEKENPTLSAKIHLTQALKGPVRRIAAEHLISCYGIWQFAENKEGAKQFLLDLVDAFPRVFQESEFYNFPCYSKTVPDLAQRLANDPKASPPDKYKMLTNVLDWATNVGYPGYATASIDEVFNTFVIPTMFAKAARGEMSPEEAATAAEKEIKRIFGKWKG